MRRRLILAAAVVAIGACIGTASVVHEPQLTELQQTNVDALDKPYSYETYSDSESIPALCISGSVSYCRLTCARCASVFQANVGSGKAIQALGVCPVCGSDEFVELINPD